jgi:hypothetical protein
MHWIPEWLRHPFLHIAQDPPGQRFIRHYERRRNQREHPFLRGALLALGMVLAVIGIAMVFTPGPGFIIITAGLTLMAARSRIIAAWLDRSELAVRARIPVRIRK